MGATERRTTSGMKVERVSNTVVTDDATRQQQANGQSEPEPQVHVNEQEPTQSPSPSPSSSVASSSNNNNNNSSNMSNRPPPASLTDAEIKARASSGGRMSRAVGAGTATSTAATPTTTSTSTPGTGTGATTTTMEEQLRARTIAMENKVRGSAGSTRGGTATGTSTETIASSVGSGVRSSVADLETRVKTDGDGPASSSVGFDGTVTTTDRASHRASRRARKNGEVPGQSQEALTPPPASLATSEAVARRKMAVIDGGTAAATTTGSDMVSVTDSMDNSIETAGDLVPTGTDNEYAHHQTHQTPVGDRDIIPVQQEPGAYRVSSSTDNVVGGSGTAIVHAAQAGPDGIDRDDDARLLQVPESAVPSLGGGNDGDATGQNKQGGALDSAGVAVGVASASASAAVASASASAQPSSTATGVDKVNKVGASTAAQEGAPPFQNGSAGEFDGIDPANIITGEAVHAQAIDEADLEAHYRDQFMRDVTVEAAVVNKDEELAEVERKARQRMWAGVCIVVLAVALGLGLGLGLTREKEEPPPTAQEALTTLVSPWSSQENLNDPSSPQGMAYNWVLNEDPQDLTGGLVDGTTNSSTVLERYALAVLYYSTDGPNWTNQLDFLTNNSVCDWPDETTTNAIAVVNCNDDGELFDLRVDTNNLSGTIPSEIAAISTLQIFTLNANNLVGTIPSELGMLDQLFWCSLDQNTLTGTIPPELAALPLLRGFILFDNALTGTIPPSILGKDETVLRIFELSFNQLTGTIPEFRPATVLEYFNVDGNQLTGTIPLTLYSQATIFSINLANNNLTGTIAEQIDGLASMESISFQNNSFTGQLPSDLSKLSLLKQLRLFDNKFTGTIPPEWGGLRDLQVADLSNNDLEGTIPDAIATTWNMIDIFSVESNEMLGGTVPSSFAEQQGMKDLNIAATNFTSGLEDTFCANDVVSTSIAADCGGEEPQIECSCCSTCCDATDGSCVVNVTASCEAKAGSLTVNDPSRGTECSCS